MIECSFHGGAQNTFKSCSTPTSLSKPLLSVYKVVSSDDFLLFFDPFLFSFFFFFFLFFFRFSLTQTRYLPKALHHRPSLTAPHTKIPEEGLNALYVQTKRYYNVCSKPALFSALPKQQHRFASLHIAAASTLA